MGCDQVNRCGLLDSGLLLPATEDVTRAAYCDDATDFRLCQRYQALARGEQPSPQLLPSGRLLPSADAQTLVTRSIPAPPMDVSGEVPRVTGLATDSELSWEPRKDDHVFAQAGPVALLHFNTRITEAGLVESTELSKRIIEQHGRCVTVSFSGGLIPIPSPSLIHRASELMQETKDGVRLSVVVLEGDGVWPSAARTAVNAIARFASVGYPLRMVRDVNDAAAEAGASLLYTPSQTRELAQLLAHFKARAAQAEAA